MANHQTILFLSHGQKTIREEIHQGFPLSTNIHELLNVYQQRIQQSKLLLDKFTRWFQIEQLLSSEEKITFWCWKRNRWNILHRMNVDICFLLLCWRGSSLKQSFFNWSLLLPLFRSLFFFEKIWTFCKLQHCLIFTIPFIYSLPKSSSWLILTSLCSFFDPFFRPLYDLYLGIGNMDFHSFFLIFKLDYS